jgi:HEAT repeat protein
LLREALGPSEREQAAQALTNGPKQAYAESVALLMDSAEHDPAATVRAACVRCLVRMNAKTPAAAELVQRLKSDPDPRVRSEAEWALSVLGR